MMEKLHQELSTVSEMVETNVNSAIMSLIERSDEIARDVIEYDSQVDVVAVEVERLCLEILQLQRQGADNLHFVVAAIKIDDYLERMSDLAVEIAEQVQHLIRKRSLQTDLSHFAEMVEFTGLMVRDSVLSLLDRNVELAFRVCAHDELVDETYTMLAEKLYGIMEEDSAKAVRATRLLLCAHDLENIADHAVMIAAEVVYMLEGKIVRHHIEEWRKKLAPELDKRRRKRAGGNDKPGPVAAAAPESSPESTGPAE